MWNGAAQRDCPGGGPRFSLPLPRGTPAIRALWGGPGTSTAPITAQTWGQPLPPKATALRVPVTEPHTQPNAGPLSREPNSYEDKRGV